MEMSLFLKGLTLGFAIAAPVGPIGILCIRRTLHYGRLSGLFSGLGAALADSFYAVIAAFSLTLISNFLIAGQFWFRLIGGMFLLYLGLKTFFSSVAVKSNEISHTSFLGDFVSTFFLTVSNPMTILFFVGIFAGLGFSNSHINYADSLTLVCGVFLGSAAWWLILSEGVTLFRKKVSQNVMLWLNRIAGTLIAAFGIAALCSLV